MHESDLSSAVRAAKKRKTAKSRSERIVFVAVFVLFFLYAATLIYPFLYCLNASLINGGRAFMRDPVGMAKPPKFVNYLSAFSQLDVNGSNFFAMTLNSVWFSFGGTILQMLFTSMAAYVVCKYRFRGREFIYSMVIVIMMIPVYGFFTRAVQAVFAAGNGGFAADSVSVLFGIRHEFSCHLFVF